MTTEDNPYNIDLTAFLEELGLTDLTDEKKKEYTKIILSMLEDRIQTAISLKIQDKDREFIENKSQEEIAEYLDSIGINIAEIATKAGLEIREEILTTLSYAEGLIENMASGKDSKE